MDIGAIWSKILAECAEAGVTLVETAASCRRMRRLARSAGRFQSVRWRARRASLQDCANAMMPFNIKLDKTAGLTRRWRMPTPRTRSD